MKLIFIKLHKVLGHGEKAIWLNPKQFVALSTSLLDGELVTRIETVEDTYQVRESIEEIFETLKEIITPF